MNRQLGLIAKETIPWEYYARASSVGIRQASVRLNGECKNLLNDVFGDSFCV